MFPVFSKDKVSVEWSGASDRFSFIGYVGANKALAPT